MRVLYILVSLGFIWAPARAQKVDEGLWNAGRAFSITPVDNGQQLVLERLTAKVQLYPGVAVVKTNLSIINPGRDSVSCQFLWRDSADTKHARFFSISNLRSHAMKVLVNKDTIWTMEQSGNFMFTVRFPPMDTVRITTLQITSNQQALLSASGTVKEANAFVYTLSPANWQRTGPERVLVQLKGDLTLTNVMGIYPDAMAKATMQQIRFEGRGLRDSANQDLVIWYQGAAADARVEKKLEPLEQQLYKELDTFDEALFDTPAFTATGKDDFSTNTRSPIISVLYFLMFTAPWVILIAFVIFLIRKPKKK